jgi:hypothetical protein
LLQRPPPSPGCFGAALFFVRPPRCLPLCVLRFSFFVCLFAPHVARRRGALLGAGELPPARLTFAYCTSGLLSGGLCCRVSLPSFFFPTDTESSAWRLPRERGGTRLCASSTLCDYRNRSNNKKKDMHMREEERRVKRHYRLALNVRSVRQWLGTCLSKFCLFYRASFCWRCSSSCWCVYNVSRWVFFTLVAVRVRHFPPLRLARVVPAAHSRF